MLSYNHQWLFKINLIKGALTVEKSISNVAQVKRFLYLARTKPVLQFGESELLPIVSAMGRQCVHFAADRSALRNSLNTYHMDQYTLTPAMNQLGRKKQQILLYLYIL